MMASAKFRIARRQLPTLALALACAAGLTAAPHAAAQLAAKRIAAPAPSAPTEVALQAPSSTGRPASPRPAAAAAHNPVLSASPSAAATLPLASHPDPHPTLAAYGKLPLAFEANTGQAASGTQFLAHGLGYTLELSGDDLVLDLPRPDGPGMRRLRFHLVGAQNAAAHADSKLPTLTNYYIGNDPKQWRTRIPNYAEVGYDDIYPGVGLRYYGRQGALENDFVVSPGVDAGQIRLAVDGAASLELEKNGDLDIVLSAGGTASSHSGQGAATTASADRVVLGKPEIYQTIGGRRRSVQGSFILLPTGAGASDPNSAAREIGFHIADYDRTQPLVIDPTLTYTYAATGGFSTLFGYAMGYSDADADAGESPSITVDANGDATLVGVTGLATLPTAGGFFQSTCYAGTPMNEITCNAPSVYIATLNPTGTALLYATYFGGSTDAYGYAGGEYTAMGASDASNDIFVAGTLTAIDLPTKGALGASQPVSGNFAAKFASDGTLQYSTYLGGSDMFVHAITANAAGDMYLAGADNTGDSDIQQINPLPLLCSSTCNDGFIIGIAPDGNSFNYGTYVGGSFGNQGNGNSGDFAEVYALATYQQGGNYLAFGVETDYPDMPTYPTQAGGPAGTGGGYVAVIDPTQDGAGQYYFAGYGPGACSAVTALALGPAPVSGVSLYVGCSGSSDMLMPNAFEPLPDFGFEEGAGNPYNGVVGRYTITGFGQVTANYVSYLGGSTYEGTFIAAVAGDANGDTWVGGSTTSPDFPVENPILANCPNGSSSYCQSGFVSEISPDGTSLLFSTFLGGNTSDYVESLALDASGNVYVSGATASTNFPVTSGALQSSCFNGNLQSSGCEESWFVAKMVAQPAPAGSTIAFTLDEPSGSPIGNGGTISMPPTFAYFSSTQVITVTNTAATGAPLMVTAARAGYGYLEPDEGENDDFTAEPYASGVGTGNPPCIPEGVPLALQPGQSCDIVVQWRPSSIVGPEYSVLEVFDNATNLGSPQYFPINGSPIYGSGATVSPNPLQFGNVIAGQEATQTVTITSTGDQELTFGSPPVMLGGSPDFSFVNTTCSNYLSAAIGTNDAPYSCTVTIAYTANGTVNAQENATLTVYDNSVSPGNPQVIALSGTPVEPEPQIVVTPAADLSGIAFPPTIAGSSSGAVTLTIGNQGTAPLAFSNIFVGGTNGTDFQPFNTTCLSAANNPLGTFDATCTVSVSFTPSQPAGMTESATLFILSNDPTMQALQIPFSGQSAAPPGPPGLLPVPVSVDNSVPPNASTVSAGTPAVNSGGQFVAFIAPVGYGSSNGSNLPGPPDGGAGVFLRNTCVGPNAPVNCGQSTQFIAYGPSGAPCVSTGYGGPYAPGGQNPAISSDGRFVAFEDTNCLAGNGGLQPAALFLRDMQAATTTQILDQYGNAITSPYSMSANAQDFAFISTAIAADGSQQIYLDNTTTTPAATTLVSQANDGGEDQQWNEYGNEFTQPIVSPDGRFVAFESWWDDVNDADGNGYIQVYLRDTCVGASTTPPCTPTTILISADNSGNAGTGGSSGYAYNYNGTTTTDFAVAGGGRYVAFASYATNLPQPTQGNSQGVQEVYLRDTCQSYGQAVPGCTPTTQLLSAPPPSLGQPQNDSYGPQISSDGRVITFLSAVQLVANAPTPGLYAYDTCLSNGQPVNTTPTCAPGLIGLVSAVTSSGQTVQSAANGAVLDPSGEYVAYATPSTPTEVWLNGTGAPVTSALPSIATSSLPAATVGQTYGPVTIATTGSYTPITVSLAPGSGPLPPGLSITGNALTGTPSQEGAYTFSLIATDNDGNVSPPITYSFSVACPTISMTAVYSVGGGAVPATINSQAGVAIPAVQFAAVLPLNTTLGLTFSASGNLDGLTFDPTTAVLSGTPTSPGTFTFTVSASGNGCSATSTTFTLVVAAPPPQTIPTVMETIHTSDTLGSPNTLISANVIPTVLEAVHTSDTLGSPNTLISATTLPTILEVVHTTDAPSPQAEPVCATLSGALTFTASGPPSKKFGSTTYSQIATVTNTGATTVNGPIYLVLANLQHATLQSASGPTSCAAPVGSPYLSITGSLAPGASVQVVLSFTYTGTGTQGITYTAELFTGGTP